VGHNEVKLKQQQHLHMPLKLFTQETRLRRNGAYLKSPVKIAHVLSAVTQRVNTPTAMFEHADTSR
jgi:hypothetical protein